MNAGRKITLFSVGAIGSALLLSKLLSHKAKKRKTPKREQILEERKQIHIITDHITFTPNGDHMDNILHCDEYFGFILPYLSTFDYLHTVCLLSKYHYLYLHHSHIEYEHNQHTLYNMLLNESNKSWNVHEIERIFADKINGYMDIYDVMYSVCNDWKYSLDFRSDSRSLQIDSRSLQIIESMIRIPFVIPNITIVKYWFHYISKRTEIPIRHLSFQTKGKDDKHRRKWSNYFVSALENPFECNLFLWIIIYNLYQLNIELNRKANKHKNIMHSNFFGFEHKLQQWLVSKHLYTFLNSDISALLKLYNIIINTKTNNAKYDKCFVTNMVYVLCIMFKVIFHNTELHIVRINDGNGNKMEWNNLEKLFLNNLYNVIVFIQYVVQINNNNAELFKTFKSLLKKSNIKMVKNILCWFHKVNHHETDVFYTRNDNILSLDVSPVYCSIMGLNLETKNQHNIGIRLFSEYKTL